MRLIDLPGIALAETVEPLRGAELVDLIAAIVRGVPDGLPPGCLVAAAQDLTNPGSGE